MPWLTCTTGSPIFSSRQVLDQRVDVADLLLLAAPARAPGAVANSSVSVTNWIVDAVVGLAPDEALRPAARPRSRSARRRPRTRPASRRSAARSGCRAAARAGSRAGLRSRRRSARGAASPRRGPAGAAAARARRGRRSGRAGRLGPGRGAVVARRAARSCACSPQRGEELLGLQEQRFGRQDRPLAVALQEAVALARVGPEALQRLVDLAVQHQRRVARRGSRRPSRSRRRTAAGSTRCRRWRCRCRCPCRARTLVGSPSQRSRQRARKRARASLVHRELAARQQAHLGHRVEAALACRGRRCGSSRSRRRTGRRGRAPASPSGTGRSGRRAPRIRRATRPGSRGV